MLPSFNAFSAVFKSSAAFTTSSPLDVTFSTPSLAFLAFVATLAASSALVPAFVAARATSSVLFAVFVTALTTSSDELPSLEDTKLAFSVIDSPAFAATLLPLILLATFPPSQFPPAAAAALSAAPFIPVIDA